MPETLPRRRLLAASATAVPVLLAVAGCRSQDVFTGADPLAPRPSPAPEVGTLQAAIAAEDDLVSLYQAAAGGSAGLDSLLSQHRQHLTQLRARLVLPPGSTASASASASGSRTATVARPGAARLRAAEHASATSLVRQLTAVEPALAQLFASIAASHATHVAVLAGGDDPPASPRSDMGG